jgi:hypothetical protein
MSKKTPVSNLKIILRNISDLIPAEYNPRQLSEEQFTAISDSIKRFGFVDPVIVNTHKDRKNVLVGGHQRVKVAGELGFTEVPTVEVNLPLKEEKELNVRLNKNTGSFDFDMLANNFDTEELMEWGFQEWELGVGEGIEEDIKEEEFSEDIETSNTCPKCNYEW